MSDTNARILALATRLGIDIKSLRDAVAAVAAQPALQSLIDDAANSIVTDKTYSAQKITAMIVAGIAQARAEATDDALTAIRDGAPQALDTLNELVTRINDDRDAFDVVALLANGSVRFDEPQTLTAGQQAQARANIGLGDVDFEAAYIAARDAA